jgi:hypothetical protein
MRKVERINSLLFKELERFELKDPQLLFGGEVTDYIEDNKVGHTSDDQAGTCDTVTSGGDTVGPEKPVNTGCDKDGGIVISFHGGNNDLIDYNYFQFTSQPTNSWASKLDAPPTLIKRG